MAVHESAGHWLDRYATGYHAWTSSTNSNGNTIYQRPLGLVETSFDTDGNYYGGRADMTATLTLEISHSLSNAELRRRIALAWTDLRLRHVLLMSRTFDDTYTRCFAIDAPRSLEDALQDMGDSIVWVEEHYPEIDEYDLHNHALNVGRLIDPEQCLSKLFVLPLKQLPGGTFQLRFLVIMAHQISDGLSANNWFKDFIRILNLSAADIEAEISVAIQPNVLKQRLPPAQEDLYPPLIGNKARQRWIWAILRVMRHVKKTFPPTFRNPLLRGIRRENALIFPPTYAKIFDYSASSRPPMSTGHVSAALSPTTSARLTVFCREAKVSIGAGCFALAGLTMMALHEARYRSTISDPFPAMTTSFPLDPRAWVANRPTADSCMLAFSEGIVMPFLPSSVPIERRFVHVAKRANAELRVYQKRMKLTGTGKTSGGLDKHSPARLLALGYLAQIERVESKLPTERKLGFANPQGELQPSGGPGATCGVSSIGSLSAYFRPGEYNLNDKNKDFVADFRNFRIGVRARDGEFLVGSSTDSQGRIGFGVSYDMNAIEQGAATLWAKTITELLEKNDGSKL